MSAAGQLNFHIIYLKKHKQNYKIMVAISIGDPAIASGGGSPLLLYGGIAAGIAATVLLWWYWRKKK